MNPARTRVRIRSKRTDRTGPTDRRRFTTATRSVSCSGAHFLRPPCDVILLRDDTRLPGNFATLRPVSPSGEYHLNNWPLITEVVVGDRCVYGFSGGGKCSVVAAVVRRRQFIDIGSGTRVRCASIRTIPTHDYRPKWTAITAPCCGTGRA